MNNKRKPTSEALRVCPALADDPVGDLLSASNLIIAEIYTRDVKLRKRTRASALTSEPPTIVDLGRVDRLDHILDPQEGGCKSSHEPDKDHLARGDSRRFNFVGFTRGLSHGLFDKEVFASLEALDSVRVLFVSIFNLRRPAMTLRGTR